MNTNTPKLSIQMDRSDNKSCGPTSLLSSNPSGFYEVRSFRSPEDRRSFRVRLEQLLTTLEVADTRKDVPMRSFLKWRMRCVWFLHRYLGGGHPYTQEFVETVDREADPYSNGRLMVARQAILEALLSDVDEGQLFLRE
jgi:hypothetical protein